MTTPAVNSLNSANSTGKIVRVRRYLLYVLAFLPGIMVMGQMFISNLNYNQVISGEARAILENTTTESLRHAHKFLKVAENQAALTADAVSKFVIAANDLDAQEEYFVSQLDLYPDFAGVYFANNQGSFFYVSRSDEPTAKYRVKFKNNTTTESTTTVWWRNSEREKLDYQEIEDDFEARSRPWYIKSTTQKAQIWTEPYVFFTTQRLGVTTAVPIIDDSGEILGVIGVDVELTELADFLSELEIKRFGSSFITTMDGTLIAEPSLYDQYLKKSEMEKASLLNVMGSNDELMKLAFQSAMSLTGEPEFLHNNSRYLVEAMPIPVTGSTSWEIVSYGDSKEFLSSIRNSEESKYWFAGFIIVASIFLGWYLAQTAWKPMAQLQNAAHIDQLTQLHNRRYLMPRANRLVKTAYIGKQPLCVVIIDIDHFKDINDTYGHAIGDRVLKIFANRLTNQQRKLDVVARLGGEEFVCVLPNTTAEIAKSIIDNERAIMSGRLYDIDDFVLSVTFSAGIADLNEERHTFEELLSAADKALYQAKQQGRDQVRLAV